MDKITLMTIPFLLMLILMIQNKNSKALNSISVDYTTKVKKNTSTAAIHTAAENSSLVSNTNQDEINSGAQEYLRGTSVSQSTQLPDTLVETNDANKQLNLIAMDVGAISHSNQLIYVHIPKTGGSTIESSDLFHDALAYRQKNLRRPIRGHLALNKLIEYEEHRGIEEYVKAATVRHPCERFISAFRYMTSDKCNEGDRLVAEKFIGSKNIQEFILYLEQHKWVFVTVHFALQYPFIMLKDKCGADVVMCQEQWEEGIQRLEMAIGRNDVLQHVSHQLLKNTHETCADLSEETRMILERRYSMDYCLFEYENSGSQTCAGTGKTKDDFTKRFHECKRYLDEQGIPWRS